MAIMTFDLAPYRDLYPFDSQWFDLDGLRYHYLDEGQGDTPVIKADGFLQVDGIYIYEMKDFGLGLVSADDPQITNL